MATFLKTTIKRSLAENMLRDLINAENQYFFFSNFCDALLSRSFQTCQAYRFQNLGSSKHEFKGYQVYHFENRYQSYKHQSVHINISSIAVRAAWYDLC